MSHAILDGDVIAYQACSTSISEEVMWDDDVETPGLSLDRAIELAHEKVEEWMSFAGADRCIIAFSGESDLNFRRAVNPEYKAQRSTEKPAHYAEVVDALKAEYPHASEPTLEGDDIIGIQVTKEPGAIAVSTDKDIFTLPGQVLRIPHSLKKDVAWGAVDNSEEDANWYWMLQTLMGDSVDGYRGCPGVGRVKAERALAGVRTLPEMWRQVMSLYVEFSKHPTWGEKFVHRGRPRVEALMNARCARILRDGDYNFDERRVKLWAPGHQDF